MKTMDQRLCRKGKHIIGKIIAGIELVVSAIFLSLLWKFGAFSTDLMIIIAIILLVLFGMCFGMQFGKKKMAIVGIVFSLLFSSIFGFASYYIWKMDAAIEKVGGAKYKTDNMVAVVRKGDKAESLLEAKTYKFGCQTELDQENTEKMRKKIDELLGQKIDAKEYASMEEMAEALLDGEIDVAIYNEAFNGILGDKVKGYESKIRVLYQYGIDTQLEEPEKLSVKEPFNVYLSGIDVYGPISTNSRSDVNIIMTVNPQTKQILLTTTPRDYYVEIPGISKGRKDKLTHAGIYGVDKSMATLEQIYGIDLNYYARVNFTSLIKIVDLLDGVDVNSDYDFSVREYKFDKGMNHLNGEQALAFARERHSFKEGDNQRGKNQEAIITAIIKKVMSPVILKDTTRLLNSVADSVETNMTKDEIMTLVRMQLKTGSEWKVTSVNAVGKGSKQACYSSGRQLLYVMYPNQESVSAIQQKMKSVLAGEVLE
ncbi:LCP family protein [Faecalimonas sp.]